MEEAQKYIESEITEIWGNENYSPREKVVNTDLRILELASKVGVKLGYRYAGTRVSNEIREKVDIVSIINSVDCNAWVSYGMWGNSEDEEAWLSVREFAKAGEKTDYEKLQPGDIAVRGIDNDGTDGHIVRIIKNCPEPGECIISEAHGPNTGTKLHKVSYDYLEKENLEARDMGCFYGEW